MNSNHLYQYSRGYAYLRKFVSFMHSIYYKEICIINPENIPANGPVIFAPNHQNALMDALSIIFTNTRQSVFMARADIFKNEKVRKILTFLKIIPVYRIRDGKENLSNNDESFEIILKVLENDGAVGIMPEGNHGDQHRLRQLKKGFARFAFNAQEKFGQSVNLNIIPVGLEYSNYNIFRSKLLVIYGQPIKVSDYMEEYALNPQRAISMLRDRLAGELQRIMLNIDTDEHYEMIMKAKSVYGSLLQQKLNMGDTYYSLFQSEKIISDSLTKISLSTPGKLEHLDQSISELYSGLSRLHLTTQVFEKPPLNEKALYIDILRNLFFLPVAGFAAAFHFIPFWISRFYSEKIKDSQFRSSVKFVLMLITFPIYYLLFMLMPIPFITKILILLIMPLFGVLTFDYLFSLPKLLGSWRYLKLKKENSMDLTRLMQVRQVIIQMLDQLI